MVMNIDARLIFKQPRDSGVTELLRKLHWLKIEDRIHFKVLCLTWQSLHKSGPSYLSDLIKFYNPTRHLRSSDKLSQRNLVVTEVANPGMDASRTGLSTFEIEAT